MCTGWYKCDHKLLDGVSLLSEEVELEDVDASYEDMNQIAAIEDEEDVAAPLTTCIDCFVALLTPQNETNDQEEKMSQILRNFITIQYRRLQLFPRRTASGTCLLSRKS